jgi:hypothetical protein
MRETDGAEGGLGLRQFRATWPYEIAQRTRVAPASERAGHDVLMHHERVHQIVLLCDQADLPPHRPQLHAAKCAHVTAVEQHPPVMRAEQAVDGPQEGCLARAAGAQQRDPLPGGDLDIDVPQNRGQSRRRRNGQPIEP